jgi:hypothetical protein
MDAKTVAEILRQIIVGVDFSAPAQMLRVSASRACTKPAGCPYSIATNVWHCDYWNRLWLARLRGEKVPSNIWAEDWYQPSENEWPDTRARFLANLSAAFELASAEPFVHRMKTDDEAVHRLHQIAAHTAYHVGQFALLKRVLSARISDSCD